MKTIDFFYELPEELIAQTPLDKRSDSRLMKLNKTDGSCRHHSFNQIIEELSSGDVLVFNNSKVIPARLLGNRLGGGKAEVLLLKDLGSDCWECLVKPGKKLRVGSEIIFPEGVIGIIEECTDFGGRKIRFKYSGIWLEVLDQIGEMPLPPYIRQKMTSKDRYQTVYAVHPGSAAAPTAGLHFTPELLDTLKEKGIKTAFVTLHIGLDTFRPVQVEKLEDHQMHSEYYSISTECIETIQSARLSRKKVIAVGTTSVRVLETVANQELLQEHSGWTDIFIFPGYEFKMVDGLITNFHLPQSTLMMLISALAGRENVLSAYKEAVKEQYRFFSFGDSMFIL